MRYSSRLILAIPAFIAVASAFVSDPQFLTKRTPVQEYHRWKLAVAQDPIKKNWDSIHSPVLRAQSVAKFCSELGCTIQAYQEASNKLKRRKRELSKQMLMVDDELDRLKVEKEEHHAMHIIFESVEIQAFSSSLWSLLPKSLQQGHVDAERHFGNIHSESDKETITILRQRQKKLSGRALAIQNLLATLQVMEYVGMNTSTKELAERYKSIAEEERINIFTTRERNSRIDNWNSTWPKPPPLPPTMKQFMVRWISMKIPWYVLLFGAAWNPHPSFDIFKPLQNQCGSNDDSIVTKNYHSNDMNGDVTPEWFARERVSAHPFPTVTGASKKKALTKSKPKKEIGIIYPFSSNRTTKPWYTLWA